MVRLPPAAGPAPRRSDATAPAPRAACRSGSPGVVQGVGFRPFVHRLARAPRARRAGCGTPPARCRSRSRAPPAELDAFLEALRREAPAAGAHRARSTSSRRAPPRARTSSPSWPSAHGAGPPPAGPARRGAVRRLRGRAVRPGQPPLPLPVHHLHRLRAALHRHRAHAVRPGADQHAGVHRSARPAPREYRDPGDRRYHSETNSCPACGPRLWFERRRRRRSPRTRRGARRGGRRCSGAAGSSRSAGSAASTSRWTRPTRRRWRGCARRKRREAKPLAVMVRDARGGARPRRIGGAEARCCARPRAARSCCSRARRDAGSRRRWRPGSTRSGSCSPTRRSTTCCSTWCGRPLVMTSGNRSDEPIAIGNDEALRAARRHRRRLPAARPGDRRPLRRFGGARGRRRAGVAAPGPRLRAAAARAAGAEPACRCWPSDRTSRTPSPWCTAAGPT